MAVKNVVRMGNRELATPSEKVEEFGTPYLKSLVADMIETMRATNGVGIAAPQIGINQRVIVFRLETNEQNPGEKSVSLSVMINPRIEVIDDALENGWEGCLSVPGLRGLVPRYKAVRCLGYDCDGKSVDIEASGFLARILQHEVDHLDGVLYPQRIKDMRCFGFEEELLNTLKQASPCRDSSDSVQPTTPVHSHVQP